MLAFFPWLTIEEELTVGGFTLVPYIKGESPGGSGKDTHEVIDGILSPYLQQKDQPVDSATLLLMDNKALLADLEEDERSDAFLFSELLSLTGLSGRKYFSWGGYCNRDNFRLIIQSGLGGAFISARRRDGAARQLWPESDYRVLKPEHVSLNSPIKMDRSFLGALVNATNKPRWENIYEGIINYNLANTDSFLITQEMEVVLLVSAYERLLDCNRGNEDELVEKFCQSFKLTSPIDPRTVPRCSSPQTIKRLNKSSSVQEMWMRDFFCLRGNSAHGKITVRSSSSLVGTRAFIIGKLCIPLVGKSQLAECWCLPVE